MTSSTRSFPTDLSILPHLLSWVRKQAEETTLSFADKMRIELALEEAVVNIIHHGTAKELILVCRHKPVMRSSLSSPMKGILSILWSILRAKKKAFPSKN